MADLAQIVDDLRAESDELDALVAPLPADRWSAPTPAAGWTIAHQIGHLLWTDRGRAGVGHRPRRLHRHVKTARGDPVGFVNTAADELAAVAPAELLADWRATRTQLHDALLTVDDGRKLPWFGPPMSGPSMATARLMETWAHGLDVADALGVARPATARLRSIAHIGVRTRDFAFVINELTPPGEPFRWSCARPTAGAGRGAPPTPRSASPGRLRTSASWSPSDARWGIGRDRLRRRRGALAAYRAGVRGSARTRPVGGVGNPNLISGRLGGRHERTIRPAA